MVALTTLSNPAPAACSTAPRFSITRSVCSRMSPVTSACVAGSSGIWPLVKIRSPETTACEYGPIALGALSVATVGDGFEGWKQGFYHHKGELRVLLLANPKLAADAARLIRDCHPLRLRNDQKLDVELAERIQKVAAAFRKVASPAVGCRRGRRAG